MRRPVDRSLVLSDSAPASVLGEALFLGSALMVAGAFLYTYAAAVLFVGVLAGAAAAYATVTRSR